MVAQNQMGEDRSDTSHRHSHSCSVSALSGVPPRLPFFNGSICANGHNLGSLLGGLGQANPAVAPLEVQGCHGVVSLITF